MLLKRVLTAAVLIPLLVLAVLYLSPFTFSLLLGGVAFLCGFEFGTMFFGLDAIRSWYLPLLAGPTVFFVSQSAPSSLVFPLVGGALFFLFFSVFLPDTTKESARWCAFSFLGYAYVVLFLPFFSFLRELPSGKEFIFFIATTVYVGDTAAYFVGSRFGRTKLAPAISPGKTWEGALASAVFGTLAGYLFLTKLGILPGGVRPLLFAFIVSTVGQMGDLFESLLKRTAGVKDSGALFPGHGGMLDRVDSFILNGAVLYFLLRGLSG
ncbi:MAG: phosphatidate cytidylyltransferase [Deltaproteobacteria bacterium]|nr:MAG: phosphatidate cytidylyltransferase [Deltaproteobacteria bacterium]